MLDIMSIAGKPKTMTGSHCMVIPSEAEDGTVLSRVFGTCRGHEGEPNNNPSHERPASNFGWMKRWSDTPWKRGETIQTIVKNMSFQKYAMPLVRSIFPELIANEIVSVN